MNYEHTICQHTNKQTLFQVLTKFVASYLIACFKLLHCIILSEMSGGGGSKSPRGPLPTFGGPPSKSKSDVTKSKNIMVLMLT